MSFSLNFRNKTLNRTELEEVPIPPGDVEGAAAETARRVGLFMETRLGNVLERPDKMVRGAWHGDARMRQVIAAARAREELEQRAGDGTEEEERDALTIRPPRDAHSRIPKMPYDFYVGQPPFRGLLVGQTMSGKTTLQAHLIEHHYGPYFASTGGGIIYISKTFDTDDVMQRPQLRRYIIEEHSGKSFNEGRLEALHRKNIDEVKEHGKDRAPQYLIVLNDFAAERSVVRGDLVINMFMHWRHAGFSILVDTQQLNRLSTIMRSNYQIAFLFSAMGREAEYYEDEMRVQLVEDVSAFRDIVRYALESSDEERAEMIEKARKRGDLVPEAARSHNFITINRQVNPTHTYRRGLDVVLEVGHDGWLLEPHSVAHANNRRWQKKMEQMSHDVLFLEEARRPSAPPVAGRPRGGAPES